MVEPELIDLIKKNLTPTVKISSVIDAGDEILAEVQFRYYNFLLGKRGGTPEIHVKQINIRADREGNIISAYGL